MYFFASAAFAVDTGKVITNECRKNLKWLNELTERFIKETNGRIPQWDSYQALKKKFITSDYLPNDPKPPTTDCKYYLVSNDPNDFQWYCRLHGVLEGDKTLVFRYKEHRIMAKTSSQYMSREQYKTDTLELLRRTNYTPRPMEWIKYHYNMNPITTGLTLVACIGLFLFLYRSL